MRYGFIVLLITSAVFLSGCSSSSVLSSDGGTTVKTDQTEVSVGNGGVSVKADDNDVEIGE